MVSPIRPGLSHHNSMFFSRKLTKQHTQNNNHKIIPKSQQQNLDAALKSHDWLRVISCKDLEGSSRSFSVELKEVMAFFTRRGRQRKNLKEMSAMANL